jgi:hypothetical protein
MACIGGSRNQARLARGRGEEPLLHQRLGSILPAATIVSKFTLGLDSALHLICLIGYARRMLALGSDTCISPASDGMLHFVSVSGSLGSQHAPVFGGVQPVNCRQPLHCPKYVGQLFCTFY